MFMIDNLIVDRNGEQNSFSPLFLNSSRYLFFLFIADDLSDQIHHILAEVLMTTLRFDPRIFVLHIPAPIYIAFLFRW